MSSFGEMLREERERRELPLDEVARETRISVRYLAALESADLRDLPGGVFNKGYVRSYARYLDLDPEPIVLAYLEEEQAQKEEGQVPSSPDVLAGLRESVAREGTTRGGTFRGLRIIIPAVLGLGLIVLAAWFALPRLRPGSQKTPTPEAGAPEAVADFGSAPTKPPAGADTRPVPTVDGPPTSTRSPSPEAGERALSIASPTTDGRAAHLSITEYGVGTRVENRRLVGKGVRFAEGSEVWFWNRITGGEPGEQIRHLWMHGNEVVGSVVLTLGGPHWRTYSRRILPPGSPGSWSIEARDAEGRVLARQEFLCEPASPGDG